eukprot:TRINITY_DN2980_c0_g1_i1.p2 TRINITY_DN2980_c0_g1~~TRINITY_DN2980_c0_g1_i1.p2  ORF type:complete len:275 (+),score=73.77 TRINITY_DN2980_c0_g1_i1:29-853(+)
MSTDEKLKGARKLNSSLDIYEENIKLKRKLISLQLEVDSWKMTYEKAIKSREKLEKVMETNDNGMNNKINYIQSLQSEISQNKNRYEISKGEKLELEARVSELQELLEDLDIGPDEFNISPQISDTPLDYLITFEEADELARRIEALQHELIETETSTYYFKKSYFELNEGYERLEVLIQNLKLEAEQKSTELSSQLEENVKIEKQLTDYEDTYKDLINVLSTAEDSPIARQILMVLEKSGISTADLSSSLSEEMVEVKKYSSVKQKLAKKLKM